MIQLYRKEKIVIEKFRSKIFTLILYPLEDETHKKALEKIKKEYDYIYIVHDRDVYENGELKKSHTHVILRFHNSHWNTALSKDLEISENYIEASKSYKNNLLYLIHFNEPDKTHYEVSECKGNLVKDLKKYLHENSMQEEEKLLQLLDIIDKCSSLRDIVEISIENGFYSDLRRNYSIIKDLFHEKQLKRGENEKC